MVNELSIDGFSVGAGRCYVIAEAGVNHDGSVERAHALIDVAADAAADAVKFQTFRPELLASAAAPKAAYQERGTPEHTGQLAMLRALTLSGDAFAELRAHALERGITFLSTAFDAPSAELLVGLGVPALKVPSGELTNHPFLAFLGEFGLPLLISTGMATMAEVDAAVAVIRERAAVPSFALLHCVSTYPAPDEDCNLAALGTMAARHGVPIGWSDHVRDDLIALAAVARGAAIVEKHFTMDRSSPGPDHSLSLEPAELAAMVRRIRRIEAAVGDGIKRPAQSEEDAARAARRGLYVARAMAAGSVLTQNDLVALRPATPYSPANLRDLVGRRLAAAVAEGEALKPELLED